MKQRHIFALLLAAMLLLALVACGETLPSDDIYENGATRLTVPAEYKDLVVVTMSSDGDTLYSVAEKASVDAGQKQHPGEDWGDGWLFSIRRTDKDLMRQYLCFDLNVDYFFAKDENDGYYLFERPSDMRLVREDYSNIPEEDLANWGALNEWAATVPESFVAHNPSVTAFTRSNTVLDRYLNRLSFDEDLVYTLSSTQFGPLEEKGADIAQYLNRLLDETTFTAADACDIPAGEYYVLTFPEENVQFRFYSAVHNYVTYTFGESSPFCLTGTVADGETQVYDIIGEWYSALAAANELK